MFPFPILTDFPVNKKIEKFLKQMIGNKYRMQTKSHPASAKSEEDGNPQNKKQKPGDATGEERHF